jgi:small subunit ribosomal protein S17
MPRRILEGEVVSDKMDKTVTVLVTRRYMHPVYKKYLRKSDKFAAHDENNQFKIGDKVQIIECRPISKSKRWTVISETSAPPVTRRARPSPASESGAKPPVAKKEKAAAPKADKKPSKAKKG